MKQHWSPTPERCSNNVAENDVVGQSTCLLYGERRVAMGINSYEVEKDTGSLLEALSLQSGMKSSARGEGGRSKKKSLAMGEGADQRGARESWRKNKDRYSKTFGRYFGRRECILTNRDVKGERSGEKRCAVLGGKSLFRRVSIKLGQGFWRGKKGEKTKRKKKNRQKQRPSDQNIPTQNG